MEQIHIWVHMTGAIWPSTLRVEGVRNNRVYRCKEDSESVSHVFFLELVSLRVEKISNHAFKTGSWYLLGLHFKNFRRVPPSSLHRSLSRLGSYTVDSSIIGEGGYIRRMSLSRVVIMYGINPSAQIHLMFNNKNNKLNISCVKPLR